MSVKRHGRVVDGESTGVICGLGVLKMLNRGWNSKIDGGVNL